MSNYKNHPLIGNFLFFILGAWFVATIFIDFFAVMAVFKNVSSIFEAGQVGMYVFTSFNKFEFIFSIILVALSFLYGHPCKKINWTGKTISIILFLLAGYYLFFLSPTISALTIQMHEVGIGNVGYETLEQTHQVFHKRYISLDSIKLLLLVVQIIFVTLTTLKLNNQKTQGISS